MEIVSAEDGRPERFRTRQGSNRFARRGSGLCEFAFTLEREALVSVYARCRHSDECGNSLLCSIDGSLPVRLGNSPVFGRAIWERAAQRWPLGTGLHRLTIETCEDGLEFDRVVVGALSSGAPLGRDELDALAPTPPPVFEGLEAASPSLPAVGPVSVHAFATGSLVIGAGHRNELTVFARLNGARSSEVLVRIRSARGKLDLERKLRLTPEARTALFVEELALERFPGYFVPVQIDARVDGRLIASERLDFVSPFEWAFLGPIPDPAGEGLELVHEVETELGMAPRLEPVGGFEWKVVEDGSCYDELGVVDLNKVFGLPNLPWREGAPRPEPLVAYAATCVLSPGSEHTPLAFAADDCLAVWVNGRQLLRQKGNAPLETSRATVGTELRRGRNWFLFKVPQTVFLWQLLFEPDLGSPYGRPELIRPCPVRAAR